MFGASVYVENNFPVSSREAKTLTSFWMAHYHGPQTNVEKATSFMEEN